MSKQNRMPVKGDITATMKTNKGDIKIILFPDAAPKTVESFVSHSKDGYYNNVVFHRVINDFMIQGGDPTATGRGGESIWGRPFEDEFSVDYHNLRGALSMANAGPNTNGSQFFIVQAKTVNPSLLQQMKQYPGGTPHLDFRHTVFGQVYEGMDVVDSIAGVATDSRDKPLDDVVIIGIDIEEI